MSRTPNEETVMMRTKLWLAAAAGVPALSSTMAFATVVVVKSLGPSAKAYPPGKTLSETAKITLQGGDVVTVLGPGSAKTLRGPGSFDAKQMSLASAASQRGRFGALRRGRGSSRGGGGDPQNTLCCGKIKKKKG